MADVHDESKARARYLMGLLLTEEFGYESAEVLLRDALHYMPELVAARVTLGVVCGGLEREEEMLDEFREAIRLDVRAVRAALRGKPKELEDLRRVLYPRRETRPREQDHLPPVPAYLADLDESAALSEFGRGEMTAGRYVHAVELLERAVRLDQMNNFAIAMLTLAYLLSREGGGKTSTMNEESVLWEALPGLAEMLFKEEGIGSRSHTNGEG